MDRETIRQDIFRMWANRPIGYVPSEMELAAIRLVNADGPVAPNWYSADEMYDWLRRENYSEPIARELAALIAKNYQLAFNKGFEIGQRAVEAKR